MTVRFFILQCHYASTLDFSNEALKAAEKGFARLMNAVVLLDGLPVSENSSVKIQGNMDKAIAAMNDDFNTPIAIAELFDLSKFINSVNDGKASISANDKETLSTWMKSFVSEVLGLTQESGEGGSDLVEGLMKTIIEIRTKAKEEKNYALSDQIRDGLKEVNVTLKDGKDGTSWGLE